MSATVNIINSILAEIERDGVDYEAGRSKGKVNRLVEDGMLGSSMEAVPDYKFNVNDPRFELELKDMMDSRDRNNWIYEVNLVHENENGGRLKQLLRKIVRRVIAPILGPVILDQNKFNASVTTSINLLSDNECKIADFIKEQQKMNEEVVMLRREVAQLRQENVEARVEVVNSRKRLHREITMLVEALEEKKNGVYTGIDYADFEDYFRGSEELVKKSQRIYIPYFEGKKNVIDLGCGRGEFLELLKENGIGAVGVEQYAPFVQRCKEKGLAVEENEAVEYVHNLEAEFVDGIFAAQLVEHLETNQLVQLCNDAYQKLQQGGCLVFETPNPTCLAIYTHAFYIDPSHSKPVHPLTLEYILKKAGFEKVEVVYPEGSKLGERLPVFEADDISNVDEMNNGITRLSEMVFGSQDYAIVAYK